jgi:DNA-binding MarR family transcriptional regulator
VGDTDTGGSDLWEMAQVNRLIHEPARLTILAVLYVVESADYVFVMRQTGLTWGNLSSHLAKLEAAGYVEIEKEFVDRKPHTTVHLTEEGRTAFREYRESMQQILGGLPE